MQDDFFQHYLSYTAGGEVPICFHRWSAIVAIGAILERNTYIVSGHKHIYPNMYTMLIGDAGTKKSTAIKLAKKLLKLAGYLHIAAERSSKEKYLADLAMQHAGEMEHEDVLERNIFGSSGESEVTPNLIAADEANDFFGISNIEFLSVLGSLWDWEGKYENRIKTGKSDFIVNPTISILAGNTSTGFSQAFPSSVFSSGFFSRIMLIYSEPTGEKITFPRTPDPKETAEIVRLLQVVKMQAIGARVYTPVAYKLVDKIYKTTKSVEDTRFASYHNRRLEHLQKLCLVISAARLEQEISETSVIQANTYLRYVEGLMPKALGEFGKAKNADTTHRVLQLIETKFPISLKGLMKEVSSELESPGDIGKILNKLLMADKIQSANGLWLPLRKAERYEEEMLEGMSEVGKLVDFETFLTKQELGVKK